MKKIILYALTAALLVACVALPTLAAENEPVNYNDYVVNYTVDGDNETVTVVFPSSLSYWKEKQLGEYGYGCEDFTVSYSTEFMGNGALYYYYIADRLDLTNIPNGSLLHFSFMWESSPIEPYIRIKVHYYDVNGTNIGQQSLFSHVVDYSEDSLTYADITVSKELQKPDGAVKASIQVELLDFSPCEPVYFYFAPLRLEMSIPSMIRLQEQTGKTNELLEDMVEEEKITQEKMDEMIAQEKENGEKLDDIMNGYESDPTAPPDSDVIGDLTDTEDQIIEDVSGGLDSAKDVFAQAAELLLSYVGAFAVCSRLLNLFADIPFFSALLYASLALGIFSLLFGLLGSVASAVDRSQRAHAAAEANKARNEANRARTQKMWDAINKKQNK